MPRNKANKPGSRTRVATPKAPTAVAEKAPEVAPIASPAVVDDLRLSNGLTEGRREPFEPQDAPDVEVDPEGGEFDHIPVRKLRERAVLAGVGSVPTSATKAEIAAKIQALGEDPETFRGYRAAPSVVTNGTTCELRYDNLIITLRDNGQFEVNGILCPGSDIDTFIGALGGLVSAADEVFDGMHGHAVAQRYAIEAQLAENPDFDGTVTPEPEDAAISAECERLGIVGAMNNGLKVTTLCEAYGIALGKDDKDEDGHPVHSLYDYETLRAKVLEAVEKKPL